MSLKFTENAKSGYSEVKSKNILLLLHFNKQRGLTATQAKQP